jgi:hypothetical protein
MRTHTPAGVTDRAAEIGGWSVGPREAYHREVRKLPVAMALGTLAAAGCVPESEDVWRPDLGGAAFGSPTTGMYHLGPVDYGETSMQNSCGPYPDSLRGLMGPYLAIVDPSLLFEDEFSRGRVCDSCALITADSGQRVYVRIVGVRTTPQSFGAMHLSQEAFDALGGEESGGMEWRLAECANTGPIILQWATDATVTNPRFWARNQVVGVDGNVRDPDQGFFFSLNRNGDGSFSSFDPFGDRPFIISLVEQRSGLEQSQLFDSFRAGSLVQTEMQF